MVNWDPEAKTNISDEEVIYKELNGNFGTLNIKLKVLKSLFLWLPLVQKLFSVT